MANEIKVTPRMVVANGNLKRTINPGTISVDMAGARIYQNTHSIGTSEESVSSFGDVGTFGWCFMRNLDGTNYVQWGSATTNYIGRMEAGETAGPFRLEPGITLYLKANTAACNVDIVVVED